MLQNYEQSTDLNMPLTLYVFSYINQAKTIFLPQSIFLAK
jgi:hypothetical protein